MVDSKCLWGVFFLVAIGMACPLAAQVLTPSMGPLPNSGHQLDPNQPSGNQPKQPYKLTGRYHLERGSNRGYVVLQVELESGAYIHPLTVEKGLNPSKIEIQPTDQLVAQGLFQPDRPPSVIDHDPIFECRMEKHFGKVQFFIPTEFNPNIDLDRFKPQISFSGQVCTAEGICIPLKNQMVSAQFSGFFDRPAEKTADREPNSPK